MAVTQNNFNLSSASATQVGPTPRHAGFDITLQNTASAGYIYLGNENVSTSSYGFRLDPGSAWSVELSIYDTVYATTDINGTSLAVFALGIEEL